MGMESGLYATQTLIRRNAESLPLPASLLCCRGIALGERYLTKYVIEGLASVK